MAKTHAQSSAADFDFIIGTWQVKHRRLKERLAQCQDWIEFDGTSSTQKILGGLGNVEDNDLHMPSDPYRAVALRSFDVGKGQWSIWWLDARFPGRIDTPVVGHFCNGTGLFYADDVLNGRPIRIRFTWRAQPGVKPRWEQAFSADAGMTWETNWVMEFTSKEAPQA